MWFNNIVACGRPYGFDTWAATAIGGMAFVEAHSPVPLWCTPLIPTSARRAMAEQPPSESDLESSVESHRALDRLARPLLAERSVGLYR